MYNKQEAVLQELDIIRKKLAASVVAMTPHELLPAVGLTISVRTLQRRLKTLVDQGIVTITGNGRSTAYKIPNSAQQQPVLDTEQASIPLNAAGNTILALISRPIQERKLVGYNPAFLNQYQPNIDHYLNEQQLQKLAGLGKTTMPDQPAGTYVRTILHRLLIDLSYNSSRLEGNTYNLLDTERLIEYGQEADDKTAADAQMILNHKAAIEFLVEDAEAIGFNRYTLLNLHGLLSDNLLANPAASGRLRNIAVSIGQTTYTPTAIPQQVEELFERILEKVNAIKNPFEQAFFVMVHLPYLQPFDDVNKHVSRLAANIPLIRHNLVPLSFIEVPGDLYIKGLLGIYELNQTDLLCDVFIWAYERSAARYTVIQQSLGEPDPFRLRYRDDIKSMVMRIITNLLKYDKALAIIKLRADTLPPADQVKFTEAVETELLSLHEGNIARYRIKPSQFAQWKKENKK